MNETKELRTGPNRTGISTSPIDSKELIEAAEQVAPSSPGSAEDAARVRTEYTKESGPIGSVPPPASLKGVVKAAVQMIKGRRPAVLIDKLAERLAFERSGSRLYEGMIAKLDATGSFEGGPTRAELEEIRDQEISHFELLRVAMERIGADPTAQTPGADAIGVASMGLLQVVADPRMSLAQGLEALLTAELTDNDGWRMLIELATAYRQDELAAEFRRAEEHEARHLELCRRWLSNHAAHGARGEIDEASEKAA